MTAPLRIVGYSRRSRERVNAYGLDAQEDAIRRWADYERAEVVAIIPDDDTSGIVDPEHRDGLSRALARLKGGEADALVVAKFDRLARSIIGFADILRLSQQEGWRLICLDPMLDLRRAADRAMAAMLIGFADVEREPFISRMRDGRRAKIAQGGYGGGSRLHRRYGFELVKKPDEDGYEYVPVEVEQKVIARIGAELAAGHSMSAIASKLNSDCIPPPAGRRWYHSAVSRLARPQRLALAA